MGIIKYGTPIEQYNLGGKDIYVKREDLSSAPPAPALAKLRGVYKRLIKVKEMGYKTIGVMDTRVSKSGLGCGAIANELGGLEVVNFYPHLVSEKGTPENQQKVLDIGHKIHPLSGGRTAVLYSQCKKIANQNGWYMMPLGLVVEESVEGVINECETITMNPSTIVMAVGSGMMIAGVSIAMANKVERIVGISAGMSPTRQRKRIMDLLGMDLPGNVEIIKSEKDYYTPEEIDCPFPSSIWYDRKAFKWMMENLGSLKEPILFWNIGV